MITIAEEEVDGEVNITLYKCLDFQVPLSFAETKATPWSIADTDSVENRWREWCIASLRIQIFVSRRC